MATFVRSLTPIFNPLAMPLAASGLIPVWGVVRHTGRKSGRSFATPIALAARAGTFFVPLPWGDRTDWCRNVLAAHGGAIRYRGHEYVVREPVVVADTDASPAFPAAIRPLLRLIGIKRFLRLERA